MPDVYEMTSRHEFMFLKLDTCGDKENEDASF